MLLFVKSVRGTPNNLRASEMLRKSMQFVLKDLHHSLLSEGNMRNCLNIIQKSLIIHEENTKKNYKPVVFLYVIEFQCLDLHKL